MKHNVLDCLGNHKQQDKKMPVWGGIWNPRPNHIRLGAQPTEERNSNL